MNLEKTPKHVQMLTFTAESARAKLKRINKQMITVTGQTRTRKNTRRTVTGKRMEIQKKNIKEENN